MPSSRREFRTQNRWCLQRGVEDAAPYKGARFRFWPVGDGVLDVPKSPRRSARTGMVCSEIEGASGGGLGAARPTHNTHFAP